MTLQQLRYFTVLGQHLHFGEAAKASFISQPSLSQSIMELETELNLKLLDRSSRRVMLTHAGKVFFHDAERIIQSADEAILRAKRVESGFEGDFNIGALGGMSSNAFLRCIAQFKKKYDSLYISLLQTNMNALKIGLLQGTLDVMLTREFDVAQNSKEFSWQVICQNRCGIIIRKDHLLARRETLELSELQQEPFVFVDKIIAPNAYNFTMRICNSRGLFPNVLYTVSRLENACAMIKAGLCVSVLPDSALMYGNDELIFIPVEGDDVHSNVVLVWSRRNTNPIVPLFLEEFGVGFGEGVV